METRSASCSSRGPARSSSPNPNPAPSTAPPSTPTSTTSTPTACSSPAWSPQAAYAPQSSTPTCATTPSTSSTKPSPTTAPSTTKQASSTCTSNMQTSPNSTTPSSISCSGQRSPSRSETRPVRYRRLGGSGPTVSVVGLGCNNFGGASTSRRVKTYGILDLEQTRAVVDAALDAGVNFFDTANVYGKGGSERFLGEILKDRRDEVVIATKWGREAPDDVAWGSRDYIRKAVEESLQRLQTAYIDLYQLHWPDPKTPIEETLTALDELVREGKVRYVGSSHFTGRQVVDADELARSRGYARMISAQNEYNLLERSAEQELAPACLSVGVGLLPFFPLASGLL